MAELIKYHVPDFENDPFPWQADAACDAEWVDPEWFFPEDKDTELEAKVICTGCPVAAQCLDLGMDHAYGVFGGLTASERRKIGGKKW